MLILKPSRLKKKTRKRRTGGREKQIFLKRSIPRDRRSSRMKGTSKLFAVVVSLQNGKEKKENIRKHSARRRRRRRRRRRLRSVEQMVFISLRQRV